jgi:hypothetical protein
MGGKCVARSQPQSWVGWSSGEWNPCFAPPNAIWIALWDKRPTLSDGSLVWPLSARAKQYAGNVSATVKGITLTVDKDIVGGPVARLPTRQVHVHRQDTAVHAIWFA